MRTCLKEALPRTPCAAFAAHKHKNTRQRGHSYGVLQIQRRRLVGHGFYDPVTPLFGKTLQTRFSLHYHQQSLLDGLWLPGSQLGRDRVNLVYILFSIKGWHGRRIKTGSVQKTQHVRTEVRFSRASAREFAALCLVWKHSTCVRAPRASDDRNDMDNWSGLDRQSSSASSASDWCEVTSSSKSWLFPE